MSAREDWRISDVAALPWPHGLFRCDLHTAIRDGLAFMEDVADQQSATRDLALSLPASQIARCEYHRPDWHLAASTAVALVELAGAISVDDLSRAARAAGMDRATEWAVFSFVAEPIIWNGGDRLGNGQHRVCAMKLSGVPRCPHVER